MIYLLTVGVIISLIISIRNMATIAELSAKVDDLQVALDAEQEKIAVAIAALKQTIADLQAAIDGAATPEQLQAVADKIDAIVSDLNSTPLE